ncbi:zinc-binding dehydrogenase [Escherichia coli]
MWQRVWSCPCWTRQPKIFDAQLRAQFGGSLAQKVIDATGNQHAMNNTVNLIRHGGTVVFVGLFKGELQFSDPEFHKKRNDDDGQPQRHAGRFR